MNANRVIIELEPHCVLPLHDSKGATVVCLTGTVWLTEELDANDVVLEPGHSYSVLHNGSTLVQAMSASRIAVEAPAARPQLEFAEPATA